MADERPSEKKSKLKCFNCGYEPTIDEALGQGFPIEPGVLPNTKLPVCPKCGSSGAWQPPRR